MNPNEESVAFYFEIGHAITQWAGVESQLALLVTECFSANDYEMLKVGFYSIENFRSKLQFAESLVLRKFEKNAHISEWQPIAEKLRKCASNRNKLAHHQVVFYGQGVMGRRYALVPTPKVSDDPTKHQSVNGKPPKGALCLRDINSIRFEFFAAYISLTNLTYKLSGMKEPFPKSAEQARSPQTIRNLRCQIHEVLGHPLKP